MTKTVAKGTSGRATAYRHVSCGGLSLSVPGKPLECITTIRYDNVHKQVYGGEIRGVQRQGVYTTDQQKEWSEFWEKQHILRSPSRVMGVRVNVHRE